MIRTVLATVMMMVVMVFAVMVSGWIIGAVLCDRRSGTTDGNS